MTTRAQHLTWCKARALAELDDNTDGRAAARAMDSMISDLSKHSDTAADAAHSLTGAVSVGVELALLEAMAGVGMRTPDEVRAWINGFQ